MTREEERAIEWDCQKLWRQYYHHVDQKEYEKAAQLFTPDIDWRSVVNLKGRDEIVQALYGALGDGTIRHVLTNMVVNVIDENHAEARTYNTIYYTRGVKIEERDDPIAFEGPHRLSDCEAEFERTEEGWRISHRQTDQVFRRDLDERFGLEIWGEEAGKLA
jgi:hypothetical protein